MDPITLVLVAAGAALLTGGVGGSTTWSMVVLSAGFYGVHRIVKSRATAAAMFAPLAKWSLGRFFLPLPSAIASHLERSSPALSKMPAALGNLALYAGLAVTIVVARGRVGRLLSGLTVASLAFGFLTGCIAHLPDDKSPPAMILEAMEQGYEGVGIFLAAACWVSLLLAPKIEARSGFGHVVGALGALVLSALLRALGNASTSDATTVVFVLTAVIGWIMCAVGVGAVARAGGSWAGWLGLGLVVLQILSLPLAFALYERQAGSALAMATGFGALGIGAAALGVREYPLREVRYLAGGLFLVAFAGAMMAWSKTLVAAGRFVRVNDSPTLALQTSTLTIALAVWVAVLALKASPPDAHAR